MEAQIQDLREQILQSQKLLMAFISKDTAKKTINSQNEYQTPTRLAEAEEDSTNGGVKDITGVKRSISVTTTESSTLLEASLESATEPSTSTEPSLESLSEAPTDFSPTTIVSERKKSKKELKQTSARVNLFCEQLTLDQFHQRLEQNLNKEVLETQLKRNFHELHEFRESFIKPLSGEVPRIVDLKDATEADLNAFTVAYKKVFVDGCNVPRVKRISGQPAVTDTEQRIAYRNFLSNCWFILGKQNCKLIALILLIPILLDFDVDGFGNYFGANKGQSIINMGLNMGRETIQKFFAAHMQSFLLNGIKSLQLHEVEYPICRSVGIVKTIYMHILCIKCSVHFVIFLQIIFCVGNLVNWTDHFILTILTVYTQILKKSSRKNAMGAERNSWHYSRKKARKWLMLLKQILTWTRSTC